MVATTDLKSVAQCVPVRVRVPAPIKECGMKTSIEYTELCGLEIYLEYLQINKNIPPEVEKWIRLRIDYLKSK